jgi:hypothetical protein
MSKKVITDKKSKADLTGTDLIDIVSRIHSPETESLGVKVDNALIRQFARRIYDSIKQEIISDRVETEALLNYIFSEVHDEIMENLSSERHNGVTGDLSSEGHNEVTDSLSSEVREKARKNPSEHKG